MKKTFIALYLCLIFCLAACTKAGGKDDPTPMQTAEPDYDNRFVGQVANVIETENEYYYCCQKYLYYYDKTSGISGVVCGKPECVHDAIMQNEDCSGYLDPALHSINMIDGRLCYLAYDYANHCQALFSIETDGTDRRLVCDLEGFTYQNRGTPQRLDCHRGKLYGYGMYRHVTDAEPELGLSVLCIDPKTGEGQVLYDFRGGYNYISFYYYRQYVYFCTSLYTCAAGSDVVIMRWNIDTSEMETVFTGQGMGGSMFALNVLSEDRVLLITSGAYEGKAVTLYSVSDGEASKVFDFEMRGAAFIIQDVAICCNVRDDKMEVRSFDGELIYRGDALSGFSNDLEEGLKVVGMYAAYGDGNEFFMAYTLKDPDDSDRGKGTCLVRYDLTQENPKGELLIYSPWG
ncbi:MAG: hypothetical protein J5772_03100 [Clostridia bacterium]|nr:hypothetical protein [Clostridia bacterium]